MQQLEEEQDRIIHLAHRSRRSVKPREASSSASYQLYPQGQDRRQRSILEEQRAIHIEGFQSRIANLPPLDLSRLDREFPLLFLANVSLPLGDEH
ncbi:hypothetical protein PsorP6_017299 [Peronosclerospora sorghi]|uniref:Uncharacterized protein n=1 Tax=Peronosclerospora sorghi TaxID=230839 RepID=A0ACC0WP81_9STRA|nr:hypothetical protein PsorP6_017299 [Peronosclerospora sorghi]